MEAVATERLWLTEPRRATCLAKVVAVRGSRFALDRSVFAPTSRAHRHPQPHDQGTIWVGGDKRILESSAVDRGVLWHKARGVVPQVGATLNCQLDQDRRELASRAHTGMHLMLAALRQAGAPPLAADPAVKGGGAFRLELAARHVAPPMLAAALARANGWVAQGIAVGTGHVLRGHEARELDAQAFEPADPYPGPPGVLDVVRIPGACAYPCDGTHVGRTSLVGRLVVTEAHARGGRFVVACRVKAA